VKKLILLFIPLVFSCSSDEFAKYTLTVKINPEDGGFVNPNGGTVTEGEQISLIATPAEEFNFDSWSGAATGTSSNVSVIMDDNKVITANFIKNKYTLAVNVSGHGDVTQRIIRQGIANETDYNHGTIVELTAKANTELMTFDGWRGDLSGNNNPAQITIDSNKSVRAVFEWIPITKDLFGWYPFNGNANDEYTDNNGTVVGATLSEDRYGNSNSAYWFDGSSHISTNAALGSNKAYSFSCWFKNISAATGEPYGIIFFSGHNAETTLRIINNKLTINAWLGVETNKKEFVYEISSDYIKKDEWNKIIYSFDLTNNLLIIKINDEILKVAIPYENLDFFSHIGTVNLGRNGFNDNNHIKGYIDDVYIWKRALSEDEIKNF